jgi:hypothetical protein
VTRWTARQLLWLALLAACGDDLPEVATEHLDIILHDTDRACQGSVDDFEDHTQRVASVLGVDLQTRILLRLGPSAVDEFCGRDPLVGYLSGCTAGHYDETIANADFNSVFHELVHAVRFSSGVKGTRFFEEGIAMVLSGGTGHSNGVLRPPESARSLVLLATLPWSEFTYDDYIVAGHFVGWLYTTRLDDLLLFLADERYTEATGVEAAFHERFGVSLAEAEDLWRTTSEDGYGWGEHCDPERTLEWDGQSLALTGRIDCDDRDTIGPAFAEQLNARPSCFTTDEPGTFRVDFDAPSGQLVFQSLDCIPTGGLTPEHTQRKTLSAGESIEVPFGRCDWSVVVTIDGYAQADYGVRMTRIQP